MSLHERATRTNRRWLLAIWLGLLLALTACVEATPTPFPTVEQSSTTRIVPTPSPAPTQRFSDEDGALSLELPADWQVVEQGMTRLGRYYQMGPEPVGPGPASSALFVAEADSLTAEEAAAALACAACDESPALEEVAIGELPALRALLGDDPGLEWYFLSHEGWLIVLTLHDPQTLETRADLLGTLELAGPAPEATSTAAAAPPPSPTPPPTATAAPSAALEPVDAWQTVSDESAAVSFAVPEGWEQLAETLWAPERESPFHLGFSWADFAPEPEALLPPGELSASEPLSLSWGSGVSQTLQSDFGRERHAVVQVGLRSYDFYVRSIDALPETLVEILDHVLGSVVLEDQLPYLEDPAQAGVDWFAAALGDPSGREARPYMSARLKEQLPAGQSALVLLELAQPPSIYLIETASSGTAVTDLQANLTLADESEATRLLRLVFDETIGWRLDEIIVPEGE